MASQPGRAAAHYRGDEEALGGISGGGRQIEEVAYRHRLRYTELAEVLQNARPKASVLLDGIIFDTARYHPVRRREASTSDSKQDFRISMGDPCFISAAHRQLVQERPGLRHRLIWVVGRKHNPVHADLQHQIEECRREVESAKREVH